MVVEKILKSRENQSIPLTDKEKKLVLEAIDFKFTEIFEKYKIKECIPSSQKQLVGFCANLKKSVSNNEYNNLKKYKNDFPAQEFDILKESSFIVSKAKKELSDFTDASIEAAKEIKINSKLNKSEAEKYVDLVNAYIDTRLKKLKPKIEKNAEISAYNGEFSNFSYGFVELKSKFSAASRYIAKTISQNSTIEDNDKLKTMLIDKFNEVFSENKIGTFLSNLVTTNINFSDKFDNLFNLAKIVTKAEAKANPISICEAAPSPSKFAHNAGMG